MHTIRVRVGIFLSLLMWLSAASSHAADSDLWVTYEGKAGAGKGKHIVLISGDEEYRSEEALPQLGKMLSQHHGFKCTVVFSLDPKTGVIVPENQKNIPGLEALKDADLMIIATRFRNLPDEQMKHIVDYVDSGRPILGMRTATHAFNMDRKSKYFSYGNNAPGGGFGRTVLGEKWISHHGHHGREATRGIIPDDAKKHPIARGLKGIFGPTDVYGVRLPLPGDSKTIVLGEVVAGMKPSDPAKEGKKNKPMMPVAWTKSYESKSGKKGRVFTTTMGAATDMVYEGTRRMLVNGAFWCVGLEDKITADLKVSVIGEFKPTKFGFNGAKQGVKPADHKL